MRKSIFGLLVLLLLFTAASAQAQQVNLRIVNNTGYTIWYLYVSPSSSGSWGSDLLGNTVLPSGSEFNLTVQNGVSYDIRLIDEDGDSYTKYNRRSSGSGNWYDTFTLSDID